MTTALVKKIFADCPITASQVQAVGKACGTAQHDAGLQGLTLDRLRSPGPLLRFLALFIG